MKKVLLILLALGIIGAGVGYYLYNKPTKSVADEKTDFTLKSAELISAFENDEKAANQKYLGKVIEITGNVSEKMKDKDGTIVITLAGEEISGVRCEMFKDQGDNVKGIKEGDECVIKGHCKGVLMDVVMGDCVISNTKK